MASAAFRDYEGTEARGVDGGADMVRRLLTHSARTRSGAARVARPLLDRQGGWPEARQDARHDDRREEEAPAAADDFARLEAELRVLKAALMAEQDEVAALRAELDRAATYAAPVGDIRGDRDRWANLVERLLFAER